MSRNLYDAHRQWAGRPPGAERGAEEVSRVAFGTKQSVAAEMSAHEDACSVRNAAATICFSAVRK